jgi:hypothetical protein
LLRFVVGFCGVVVLDANIKADTAQQSLILFVFGAGWMHMALAYLLAALSTFGASEDTIRKVWRKRFWLDNASGLIVVAIGAFIA